MWTDGLRVKRGIVWKRASNTWSGQSVWNTPLYNVVHIVNSEVEVNNARPQKLLWFPHFLSCKQKLLAWIWKRGNRKGLLNIPFHFDEKPRKGRLFSVVFGLFFFWELGEKMNGVGRGRLRPNTTESGKSVKAGLWSPFMNGHSEPAPFKVRKRS